MKKFLICFLTVSFLIAGCDRSNTRDDNEREDMSLNNRDTIQQRGNYYTFSGTFEERKSAFKNAAAQLEQDVNNLASRATSDDEREDLEEVREKIAEAREKSAEADEKSANNKTDEAIEKVEEAREKLEEAREKYEKALEEINN